MGGKDNTESTAVVPNNSVSYRVSKKVININK